MRSPLFNEIHLYRKSEYHTGEELVEDLEKILFDELSALYGAECAKVIIVVEKRRSEDDMKKMLAGIRGIMSKVGGESYAEKVYNKIQKKMEVAI